MGEAVGVDVRVGRPASGGCPASETMISGSSRKGADRVHAANLEENSPKRQVLASCLDETEGGGVPESGRATVAEHDLVAVGQREELGQAGAQACPRRCGHAPGDGSCRGRSGPRSRGPRTASVPDLRGSRPETAVGRQQVWGSRVRPRELLMSGGSRVPWESQQVPRPEPGAWKTRREDLCKHMQMATSPPSDQSSARSRDLEPRRRRGPVGHLGHRCEGEAAEGRKA